jgi:hypothetical protein
MEKCGFSIIGAWLQPMPALYRFCYTVTFFLPDAGNWGLDAGMKEILQKSLIATVIASEASHIFCCVLPTLFSLMSLLVGMGLIATMPNFLITVHDYMHAWEVPIISFSGIVLALGWAVTLYSDRLDCHHTGCGHGACAPKKSRAHIVLTIATALFLFNLAVYVFVHRAGIVPEHAHEHVVHEAHDDHHHE